MEIIKKIGGIGTKRGEALEKAGIRSLEDLRRMDIEVVSQSTGIGKESLRQFKAVAELQRIPTVDHQLSAALVSKGNVYDLVQLANANPDELQGIIAASIEDGTIPAEYKALGAGDFQSWIKFAMDLSCYEQLRSDRQYLNYLIDLSGESPSELEGHYHQRFTQPEDENAEDENSPIETIKICVEVLQGDLDGKGYNYKSQEDWVEESGDTTDYGYLQYLLIKICINMLQADLDEKNHEYQSQEEWAQESGDTTDYGYLQYLCIEAQSDAAREMKKMTHILSEHYKINFFVDPLEITTRVRQCIRTLQAILREAGIVFDYRNQWVQRLDRADFPENFYQVKQRLIKGDVEALRKQVHDCEEILSTCYIKYDNTTSKFSEHPIYSHVYKDMRAAIDLIKEMVKIDDLIAAGHKHFFDEAYQWAINSYFDAYDQIRRILPSLYDGLRLPPILHTGYPLESVSAQIASYFKNLEQASEVAPDETLFFKFYNPPGAEDEPVPFELHDQIDSNHGLWKIVDDGNLAYWVWEPLGWTEEVSSNWDVYHSQSFVSQREEDAHNLYDLNRIGGKLKNRRRGTFLYYTGGTSWKNYTINMGLRWSREGDHDFGVMFRFSSPPDGWYYRLALSRDQGGMVYLVKGGHPLYKDKSGEPEDYVNLLDPVNDAGATGDPKGYPLACPFTDTGEDLFWKVEIEVKDGHITATIIPKRGFDECDYADPDTITVIECDDPDPITRGTIALYCFGLFCRWKGIHVTLHGEEKGILTSNPFQISDPEKAKLSSSIYEDRLAPEISLQRLQDLVSITAENFHLVDYGIKKKADDNLNDFQIIYNEGDNKVNRDALAQLLGTLPYLIPHYYFYILPIALGDCHWEMGDFEQAKAYYNLVYQPAGLCHHIRSFEAVEGDWELEGTPIVLKEPSGGERDYVTAGSKQWSDYKLELEAKKTGGDQDFLIFFRYTDGDHWLCWDVGRSLIQSNQGGTIKDLETSADPVPVVDTGQWYKIDVTAQGRTITCSIDGTSLTCELPQDSPHLSGCIGLGASETTVECRNVRVTLLNEEPIYPYLNPRIEYPLMRMRLAQNYIDWGNYLYRQQDDESVDRAKEMYRNALCVHEAEYWCEQDLYESMEEAVKSLIEADPPLLKPQVLGNVILAMEEAKYLNDISEVKEIYENVVSIVTSDIAAQSMIAELSSALGRNYTDLGRDVIIVEDSVSGFVEQALVPTTWTGQPVTDAYALRSSRMEVRHRAPTTGIVPYGAPSPGPTCTPENPLILRQKRDACLHIYMIEQGLNYLGYRNNYLSIFRYAYLAEQAKAFANLALSAEREFLSFKEKFERESLTNLQARQALALALATVQLQELRRIEAVDRLTLSRMQVGQVYAQIHELEKKLAAIDWMDYIVAAVEGAVPLFEKLFESGDEKEEKAGGETAFYDLIKGDGRVTEAAEEEAGGWAAAAELGGWTGVAVKAGIGIIKGIASVEDQKDSLEDQIRRLKTQDLPLAKQNVQVAKDQLMIAVRQKDIAIMKAGFAQEILEFLRGKFLNVEMWSYLARSIKEIYELYMEYAITLAWLAERALEFERGSEINRIRFNYFSAARQGLLAAENLTRDIASLEYDKLVTEEKKIPIKQVVSLTQLFPQQLSTFLKNGKTEFYIPLELFDSLYPGLYQARIKNVELLTISAVPLTDVHGTLTNLGVSRIRALDHKAAGKRFVEMAIYNQPETITLSSYAIREDQFMFQPSEAEKILQPFEGLGVDSYWILDLSKEVNDIDFSQIIDVQLILYYTAQYDEDLKNKVIETLPRIQACIQPFSLKYKAAEPFEEFISPAEDNRARDMRIFSFETRETDFPTNQEQRRIKNLFFFSKSKDGGIAPLTAHIFSAQYPEAVRVESDDKGFIGSNIGADDQYADPSPLNALTDLNVADRWYLKILPEDNPDLLKKNAAGNVVSDPGNGFLRVSGPTDMGTPKIQGAWPNDLGVIAKVRLDKGQVRFRLRKSEQGEYQVDFASEGPCLHRSEPRDGAWTREMLWQDQTPHLENTWYEIGILVIQDMIQVFVDGVERIKYKDEDGTFTQGSFALHPINESEDSSIDIDDFQIQEVDQFGMAKADLFEDRFTGGLENWDIEGGGNWEVAFETSTVNPTLDLTAIEDILVLMEYEYAPGLEPTHLRENPEVDEIDLPASSNLVEISPDGRWCCILSQEQKELFVLSTMTKRIVRALVLTEEGRVPRGIAISPDGTSAFISIHVVSVRLVTEWMNPDEAEDLLASLESVEGYQGLFTVEEGTLPSGAAAGWEMSVERKPGLRLLAGDFPRAGIPLTISDPWGNTVSLVSGSKPEHGQGGFETPIWDNGNYTIRFLDQTFQVLVQDDFVFVTFTELTARLVSTWLPVAEAQELWEDLEGDENYQGVFKVGDRDSIIRADLSEYTTSEIHSWNAGAGPHGVVLSPDGRYLYVAMRDRGSIVRIDLPAEAGPEKTKEISVGEQPEYLALSPEGKPLYVAEKGDFPRLWIVDTEEGTVSEPIEVEHDPNDLAISPDGQTLYVTNSYGRMSIIDTDTKENILTLDIESGAKKVAFSPDGKRAYVTMAGESEGKLLVIDTAAVRAKAFDQDIHPIVGHVSLRENPNDIAFHPLGVRAYVVHDSTNIISIIE